MPVLYIEYKARAISNIREEPQADIKFSTEYSMAFADSKEGYYWAFALTLVAAAVITCCCSLTQATALCGRPALSEDPTSNDGCTAFTVKLLVNGSDLVSKALFCYLLAVTGRIFIFFKMQERVHTFLPGGEEQKELET